MSHTRKTNSVTKAQNLGMLLVPISLGFLLAACGKSAPQNNVTDQQKSDAPCAIYTAQGVDKANSECGKDLTHNLDLPNVNTADSEYIKVKNGEDLLYILANISTNPPDYGKIASALSPKYHDSSDAFVKQEIVQQIKPSVDAQIQAYKGKKYFEVPDFPVQNMGSYNFETHSFTNGGYNFGVRFYVKSGVDYNNIPELRWFNGAQFTNVKVEDLEVAKQIEKLRVSRKLVENIYFYANNADMRMSWVYGYITKITYADPSGNVLFTQYAQ